MSWQGPRTFYRRIEFPWPNDVVLFFVEFEVTKAHYTKDIEAFHRIVPQQSIHELLQRLKLLPVHQLLGRRFLQGGCGTLVA